MSRKNNIILSVILFAVIMAFSGCTKSEPSQAELFDTSSNISNNSVEDLKTVNATYNDIDDSEDASYIITKEEAISILTKEGRIWYENSPDLDYEVFVDKGDYIECVWHDRFSEDSKVMYSLKTNPVDMTLEYDDGAGYRKAKYEWIDTQNKVGSPDYDKRWYLDDNNFDFDESMGTYRHYKSGTVNEVE